MNSPQLLGEKSKYAVVSAKGNHLRDTIENPAIFDLYKEHGAVIFRGYDLNLDTFKHLTHYFCYLPVAQSSRVGRTVIDVDSNIQTVNMGVEPFPLHPELSRQPWKPDVCFFACVKEPTSGGETTICDGEKVVAEMPKDIFDVFNSRRLLYRDKVKSLDAIKTWFNADNIEVSMLQNPPPTCPYKFDVVDGDIYASFTVPGLHKTMFSKRLAFGNFLFFSRWVGSNRFPVFDNGDIIEDKYVNSINDICNQMTEGISWEQNDILMLDNTRFMHGRNRVVDINERLIMTYFGYLREADLTNDEFKNCAWRLPLTSEKSLGVR